MGLFDFLKGAKGDKGAADEKAVLRHGERVMDKRAMSPDRFASIEFLCRLGTPEAWRSLLPRFNFNVDPSITDREEKQYIFDAIVRTPDNAVEPIAEYLRAARSLTWPIKMLHEILEPEDFVEELLDYLETFDTGYEKDAERKGQIIAALEEVKDARITPALLRFLEDFSEDIRFHAIRALVAQGDEASIEPLAKLLCDDASARIRSTILDGFVERGWAIPSTLRDKAKSAMMGVAGGYSMDKEGRFLRR